MGLRASTSSISFTIMLRKSPRGAKASINRFVSSGVNAPPDQQRAPGLLDFLEIRHHVCDGQADGIVVDLKGNGYLGRTGTANHVVVNDLSFAGQAHMIIYLILRLDHFRDQKLRRLPTLTSCEFFSLLISLFRV